MSLVPYAATAYSGWQSLSPSQRATLITARNQVMAYGKRKFVSYYNSRKKRRILNKIGRKRNTSNSKRSDNNINNTGTDALDTRTLYALDLTRLIKDNDRSDARHNDIVNLNGVKLCIDMWNNLSDGTPITNMLNVNMAVVHPKNLATTAITSGPNMRFATGEGIETTKFFRSSDGSRGEAFNNTRTSQEMHCSPINTDKFDVLSHKRFKLANLNNPNLSQGKGYKSIMKWIPIRRQLTYMDYNATTNPNTNAAIRDDRIFLLIWCDSFTATTGTSPTPEALNLRAKVIKYFREPRK